MSLKAIAEEGLARLKAGETEHETKKETELKQVKQPVSCFIDVSAGFTPMKHAEAQKTAKNAACFTVSFPRGGTHETTLPNWIAAGLERLPTMRPPRITRPEVWPEIVADALRLAVNPDVSAALRTGWHPLHFWGCCPSADADPALEGLAVRLRGRKPLIYETHAIMESAAATHSVFTPRAVDGAIFLWELGRSRDGR